MKKRRTFSLIVLLEGVSGVQHTRVDVVWRFITASDNENFGGLTPTRRRLDCLDILRGSAKQHRAICLAELASTQQRDRTDINNLIFITLLEVGTGWAMKILR